MRATLLEATTSLGRLCTGVSVRVCVGGSGRGLKQWQALMNVYVGGPPSPRVSGPFDPQDPFNKTHKTYTLPSGDLTTGFHTYGLIWNETTMMTYIDSEDQVVLYVDLTKETFWERGGWGTTYDNPWAGGGHNAPFDQGVCM